MEDLATKLSSKKMFALPGKKMYSLVFLIFACKKALGMDTGTATHSRFAARSTTGRTMDTVASLYYCRTALDHHPIDSTPS
jgi:hypothetical protein